jgi:16S rRNA (adenine1518-N6/adenine1519-N6)-dimethyltransferase
VESPGVLLRRHGLHPKKQWGQNFLGDVDTQARIAALTAATPADTLVELGAGLGHLTSQLARSGARILAVERDRELAPVLRAELGPAFPNVTVVEADATSFDLAGAAGAAGRPLIVCGNLPYHLGSPILFHVLDHRVHVKRVVVLLQKEVVERIVAAPDTEHYGLLSVLLQHVADVELALKVPSGVFVPPPAVDSAVLVAEMLPSLRAPVSDELRFRALVKAAFAQRRKTLWNALKAVAEKPRLGLAAERAGVDLGRRGETLSVEEFAALERALAALAPPRED